MNIKNTILNLSPTAKIAVSLIAKDAVGCYLYVSQARSNKKFTPQQRSDVANYDLANGIINIFLQLLAVKPIENLMTKVVDSKMMKNMYNNLDQRLGDSDNKNVIKLLKNKKRLTEGAVALFSVLICQYFIKRVVSPYFSVPAGDKSKELGIIKPKLYEGETFEKTSCKKANDDSDEFDSKFEKVEDLKDDIEDKLEDFFEKRKELQKIDD